jgi:hypothetical protein
MRRYQQLGEVGYMAEKRALALGRVRQHPGEFALTSARRAVLYWTGFWSLSRAYLQQESFDYANIPFCTALLLFTVLGAWRLRRDHRLAAFPFFAVLAVFPLPYYVTHASMDYREAIEPVIVAVIACAVTWLSQLRRRSFLPEEAAVETLA